MFLRLLAAIYYIWQRVHKENFVLFVAREPNEKMLRFVTFFILLLFPNPLKVF